MRRVLFLDRIHSNTREWEEWGAGDLFMWLSQDSRGEGGQIVLFAHASDFLDRKGMSSDEINTVREFCRGCPVVIVVSGGTITSSERSCLQEVLDPQGRGSLHFYERLLPVSVKCDELEQRFRPFLTRLAEAQCDFDILYTRHIELVMVLRILWETYVLAKTDPGELPEKLHPVRQKLEGSTFGKEYWSPILKSGTLNSSLAEDAGKDIAKAIAVMRDQEDWNTLSISDKVISDYRKQWLARVRMCIGVQVSMLFNKWQSQRALLNHDILCNQLRNELGALRATPHSPTVVRLKMWPLRQEEYRAFFDLTIEALSPQQLLALPVFACWDQATKEAFGPLFHEIFMVVTNIAGKVRQLHELISRSVDAVEAFLALRPTDRTSEDVERLQELLDSLSEAVSALPRGMDGTE